MAASSQASRPPNLAPDRLWLDIMERARTSHPSLGKIVILEHLPRADDKKLSTLSHLYNATLRNLAAAAPLLNQCEIVVASHSSLLPATQDANIRSALFGLPSSRGSDGIHFRGKEGSKLHTNSVIAALKSAILGGWTTQRPKGRHLESASRLDDQRRLDGDHASTPRTAAQEYNV